MNRPPRTVSLARALSKLGLSSRADAVSLVRAGRVRVNGRTASDPDIWVDPDRVRIEVDGAIVRRATPRTIVLHKPAGVVTTRRDERARRTVYDLLPKDLGYLFPIGRLDLDTSGLLLLTNDVKLGDRLTSPSSKVWKRYRVEVDAPVAPADVLRIAKGVIIAGQRTLPARVRRLDARRLEIEIIEGRNRQVRRMLEAVGRRVVTLHREAIGPLALGGLPEGHWRDLTAAEARAMRD